MSVKGFDEAIAKVERFMEGQSRAQREAAQEWLDNDFLPEARQLVPKDTGELMESIGGRVTADSIEVFATAGHARWVEEGTSTHMAQPYMRPAWDRNIHKLKRRIIAKMKRLR